MTKSDDSDFEGFIQVAKVSEVSEGSMIGVAVSGRPVLIAKLSGKLHAVDAVCSHHYGYLPKGSLSDNVVTCPVHKAQFDVETGKVVRNVARLIRYATRRKATDLSTYEVKVAGANIFLRIHS